MRSLNSSHVVGGVSGVHGMCGLLPSAGQLSLVLVSSLFWSLAWCAMCGRPKGSHPLLWVGTAPLTGGGDFALRWCEDRSCETPGDALSKLNLDMIGQDLLFLLEKRRVLLVGGAPGWCESLLLLVFSPGRCFPGFLSVLVLGPATKESSQSKEVYLSVRCESFPTLHVQASMATACAERAYVGAFVQFMSLCAAAASVATAFMFLGALEAGFSAAAALVGDFVLVSLYSVLGAMGAVVLGEPDSSAATAFYGALCLSYFYSVSGDADVLSTGVSSVAAALDVDRNSMLDDDWEVVHNAASCLTAGTGVQASGRLDVPGGVPHLAAAPSQSPPLRFAPTVSKATDTLHVVSHVTLLVRSLSGKMLVVDGDLGEPVSQFSSRLALLTGIPRCHFYLTHHGRIMGEQSTLGRQRCGKDALICMRSGLREGVKPPVGPGSWHCYTCKLGKHVLGIASCWQSTSAA